ncbi:flagellar hook-associated protein FlgK [Peribacillus cavernae]|uniref:Flagellar hook-associated protein 1 n=1 Tax=Peribacillus cavernae TaxID=1674310 RepID=A0A433HSY2_9BACI|nr:flagellar hook-associated protein FlgK [Peribacillus cavernae]MDQ0218420.1 flagellar hook-associated protein 1 FlgK [Peribacillus cavernae]RUQ31422.1 flagellar hook-associated protein FlgK [Peribacillus cavernae]
MRSTFMGLETARRGMFTQQSALYTTGHNISNANTPGYSRQRVNFTQTTPYPTIGMNSPYLPGQTGTGVEAGSVQRIRESFLDTQYRNENNKIGYYGTLSESLTKMEEIMNEPTDSGLHATLEKFWKSLQDLSSHTENSGARDVVAASGQMVADTLNYYYNSLNRVQDDIGSEIDVKTKEINALVSQINNINKQIAKVEPHGYLPNDLYDERDLLVDNLSSLINVKVTNVIPAEYGNVKSMAEGLYNIEVVQEDGTSYDPPRNLISVDKTTGSIGTNELEVVKADGVVTEVKLQNGPPIPGINFSGQLAGLIESYGYKSTDGNKGHFPAMIDNLNKMTEAFANEFNYVHSQGYSLGGTGKSGLPFFSFTTGNAAKTIAMNQAILDKPELIAAGLSSGASGDNGNAQILADLKKRNFTAYESVGKPIPGSNPTKNFVLPDGLTGNLDSFYSGIIGKLGVDSQSAQKNNSNSAILADSVNKSRESVSAVSLDEEMTNMIKFQHAYNASARNITVIDEMLDKIINGMGVVGR